MIIIFCVSHMYVPATLDLISQEKGDLCIYTDLKSLYTFFSKMYPDKKVFWDDNTKTGTTLYKLTLGVIKDKRRKIDYFDKLSFDKVVFFHEGDVPQANWLIKRIYRRQKPHVVYIPVQRSFYFGTYYKEPLSVKRFLQKLITYFVWHYWSHYYLYLNSLHLVMDKSFFKATRAEEQEWKPQDSSFFDEIDKHLLPRERYPVSSIVWIENTLTGWGAKWDENSYIKVIDNALDCIKDRKIFFKGHPDMVRKYGRENEMEDIPAFIPGSLMLKRFSCYIGVVSALLYEAADAGTPTICLLKLIDMDEKKKSDLVSFMKDRNNNIMFPETLEKLNDMIKNL